MAPVVATSPYRAMRARRFSLIHKLAHRLTGGIEHRQIHQCLVRQVIANGRRGIEGIGEAVSEREILRQRREVGHRRRRAATTIAKVSRHTETPSFSTPTLNSISAPGAASAFSVGVRPKTKNTVFSPEGKEIVRERSNE